MEEVDQFFVNVDKKYLTVKKLLPIVFEEVVAVRFKNGDSKDDSTLAKAIRRASSKGTSEAGKKVYLLDFDNYTSVICCNELYTLYLIASLSICQIIVKLAISQDHLKDMEKELTKEYDLLCFKTMLLESFTQLDYRRLQALKYYPALFINLFLENKFNFERCDLYTLMYRGIQPDLSDTVIETVKRVLRNIGI